ncbi:hypothetical protein GW17_00038731, partial [Ensete ventricosum]
PLAGALPLPAYSHPVKGRPPLWSVLPPLLATGPEAGDSPLREPCSRPPLQAPRYKRVCPSAVAAPTGWPQPAVPTGAASMGCCPHERRRPRLQAAAPMSGADLPCGLALAIADRPLVGGLGRGLAMGGRSYMGAGSGWPPLLLAALAHRMILRDLISLHIV